MKIDSHYSKHSHYYHWVIFLVISVGVMSFMVNQIKNSGEEFSDSFPSHINVAKAAGSATLSLSPASQAVALNQNFNVNVLLNTGGGPVDGVDIFSLHFNPAILQVVDSDAVTAGVQITPGSLLPNTVINTVNNSTGVIQFSQSVSGGTNFTGSGTLATITFKGQGNGTSATTFDFTLNSTADTNVAFQGADQLGSVTNGNYTVDGTAPSTPTGLTATAISTSQINLAWTAATDNVGVTGYKIFRGGTQINTSATNSYSDTGLTPGTLYSYTVSAFDAAANNSAQSTAATATTQNTFNFTMTDGGNKSVVQGSSVTNTATTTLSAGTTSAVTFSASGLPAGAGVSFSPTSCSPTCTTTMTITTTAATPAATSTITITGTGGGLTRTTTFSLTVNSATFTRTISLAAGLEARTSLVTSGTIDVLTNPAKTLIKSYAFTTNASGLTTVTFDIAPALVYLKIKVAPYLTRLVATDLNTNTTYVVPQLLTGDINQDNIVNSIDYSTLNTNWFTTNAAADLNVDGLVNSIDFSFMNIHWLSTGEQ